MNAFEIKLQDITGFEQIDHMVLYRLTLREGQCLTYTHIEAGALTFWSRVRLSLSFLLLPWTILFTGHSLGVRLEIRKG